MHSIYTVRTTYTCIYVYALDVYLRYSTIPSSMMDKALIDSASIAADDCTKSDSAIRHIRLSSNLIGPVVLIFSSDSLRSEI